MSADNQAEPAAAMSAAAAAAPAASASEYLKRTCLICGCQTNQAINIYEPRSGPNIVQLIQAKFKFQPLNEDKFLCFSCNNWLINWHSLQALNSNDAESHSRSQSPSHMGNNSSGALVQQQSLQAKVHAKVRPVAQVRPMPQPMAAPQNLSTPTPAPVSMPIATQTPTATRTPTSTSTVASASSASHISYNKRYFGGRTGASSRGMRKMLRKWCACGSALVMRLLTATPKLVSRSGGCRQCRNCRENELSKLRTLHRRSQAKVAQLQRALEQQQQSEILVKATVQGRPQYQRFQAPRVDGKVVAMFRRLGTTLSTEDREPAPSARPLRIMSPVKQRPRWTRTLDEDEILLEFDSAITEVLPSAMTPAPLSTTARRRLCYQVNSAEEAEAEREAAAANNRKSFELKVTHQTHVDLEGLQLPQGLSITLI